MVTHHKPKNPEHSSANPEYPPEGKNCVLSFAEEIFISIASGKGAFSSMDLLIQQEGLANFFTVEKTFNILTRVIDEFSRSPSKSGNEIKQQINNFLSELSSHSIRGTNYSLFYINSRDLHGKTLLMIAAERGNEHLVEALKEFGADPTLKDNMGRTASWLAKMNRHDIISQQLEEDAKKFNLKG